jgi:hypothetical protein
MGIARSPGRQYEKNDHEHHRLSVFHGPPHSRASPWGQVLAIFWLPASLRRMMGRWLVACDPVLAQCSHRVFLSDAASYERSRANAHGSPSRISIIYFVSYTRNSLPGPPGWARTALSTFDSGVAGAQRRCYRNVRADDDAVDRAAHLDAVSTRLSTLSH